MDCTTYPLANALNYCAAEGYAPGKLHLGTIEGELIPDVLLINLASGRIQRASVDPDQLPEVVIDQPDDLSPGHTYRVLVVGKSDVEGISPIEFFPFVFDGEDYVAAEEAVAGVSVPFVKVFDGNDVHSHAEQWITLL